MIDKLIEDTLSTLKVPVQRLVFKGKEKPPTYVTWQYINSPPSNYADDESQTTDHTMRVHIFSKNNYSTLLENLKRALKNAGFTISSIDGEIYEEETGFFHRPITIQIMEE